MDPNRPWAPQETKPPDPPAAAPAPKPEAKRPPDPTVVGIHGLGAWFHQEALDLVTAAGNAIQNNATPANLQTYGDEVVSLASDFVPTAWRDEFTALLDSVVAGEAPNASNLVISAVAVAQARITAVLNSL